MKELIFWLAWLGVVALIVLSGPVESERRERIVVDRLVYEWAEERCEGRGWRKITYTAGSVGVLCRGGGVHVLDWGARRTANAD